MTRAPNSPARVTRTRKAGSDHAVLTIEGGPGTYRRTPCGGCPWRLENVGRFPPEAFRHSAPTSYDMAGHTFACHESGKDKPAVCAGFLLRCEHNLSVREAQSDGKIDVRQVSEGDAGPLFASYREMAVANGVPMTDPALEKCR